MLRVGNLGSGGAVTVGCRGPKFGCPPVTVFAAKREERGEKGVGAPPVREREG